MANTNLTKKESVISLQPPAVPCPVSIGDKVTKKVGFGSDSFTKQGTVTYISTSGRWYEVTFHGYLGDYKQAYNYPGIEKDAA